MYPFFSVNASLVVYDWSIRLKVDVNNYLHIPEFRFLWIKLFQVCFPSVVAIRAQGLFAFPMENVSYPFIASVSGSLSPSFSLRVSDISPYELFLWSSLIYSSAREQELYQFLLSEIIYNVYLINKFLIVLFTYRLILELIFLHPANKLN